MKPTYTLALVVLSAACTGKADPDVALATTIAKGLLDACPAGQSPASETARNDCAAKLTDFATLRNAMREPFIWGGQQPGIGYRLDMSTNKFNARVWRRMYLSTFMFGTDYTIEQPPGATHVSEEDALRPV